MEKTCGTCFKVKSINDFADKGKRKQSYCKDCQKIYRRKHYLLNKEKYIKKARFWEEKRRQDFIKLKSKPCVDCNTSYPYYVMDFDHRDGEKKEYSISQMADDVSMKTLLKEIKKCDLVCSNCHRIRTFNRRKQV